MHYQNAITLELPPSLQTELSASSSVMKLRGKGNDAVVLYDPATDDIIKVYGHNKLLSDPRIYTQIEYHYTSEVFALKNLSGSSSFIPELHSYGRVHPVKPLQVEDTTAKAILPANIYGWIRMSHMDGLTQDIIAVRYQASSFTHDKLNDGFYHSVGFLLGQFHNASHRVRNESIPHNIHEKHLQDLKLFMDYKSATWEANLPSDQFHEQVALASGSMDEVERSYETIESLQSQFGLVHGDFAQRNMLYADNDGQIKASAIVDFGQTGIGIPEFDFLDLNLASQPKFLAGYDSVRPEFSPERLRIISEHQSCIAKLQNILKK